MKCDNLIVLFISLSLLCVGCRPIIQEPFEINRRTSYSTNNPVYGDIQVDLLFQREEQPEIVSAEDIAAIFEYTLRAYGDHFGEIPVNPRHLIVTIIDINSSQWQAICFDEPYDSWHTDGCSSHYLFPETVVTYQNEEWQIAINSAMYNRGYDQVGLYVHEILHGLLWYDNRDDDNTHSYPGVWENDPNGVYHSAMNLMTQAWRNGV